MKNRKYEINNIKEGSNKMSVIAAISTATGAGGIGIIRMSGKECFSILEKIFVPKNKKSEIKGYSIKYGQIIDSEDRKSVV